MEWKNFNSETPELNYNGKCTRLCEVQLEDSSTCFAYYCIVGWYMSTSAYDEYKIKSPVRYWRYL